MSTVESVQIRSKSGIGVLFRGAGRLPFHNPYVILLLVLGLLALVVPAIWPEQAYDSSVRSAMRAPFSTTSDGFIHVFGTDQLGRDVLIRAFAGLRVSLALAFAGVAIAGVIGLLLGACAGYFGGWVDTILARLMDAQQALPTLAIALIVAVLLEPSTRNVVVILAVAGWVNYARLLRGETFALREQEFVQGAVALGASGVGVIARHIIPNLLKTTIVIATVEVGRMVLLEASLSFLGFGIQPPTPSVGAMIRSAQSYLFEAPWLGIVPGVLLLLLVLAVNQIGDKLTESRP